MKRIVLYRGFGVLAAIVLAVTIGWYLGSSNQLSPPVTASNDSQQTSSTSTTGPKHVAPAPQPAPEIAQENAGNLPPASRSVPYGKPGVWTEAANIRSNVLDSSAFHPDRTSAATSRPPNTTEPAEVVLKRVEMMLKSDESQRASYVEVPTAPIAKVFHVTLIRPSAVERFRMQQRIAEIALSVNPAEQTVFRVNSRRLLDEYMSLPNKFRVVSFSVGQGLEHSDINVVSATDFDQPEYLPQAGKEFNPMVRNADGSSSDLVTPNYSAPVFRKDGSTDPRYYHLYKNRSK